ncbi:hypothetical protein FS749_005349 [Ceratobasidium sp. UAMH 11750]|nr:hypothetical protein FS749_005349 [Ceratobasidium sp. UAMH 11750]
MAAASTHRRSNRHRQPPPVFKPAPPSPDYLALSQIPSNPLSTPQDGQPLPRKLLVLDLNGTLLLRSPRTYSGPRIVMARPYAKTFRKYVFHEDSQLDVMVWSSAQPHNVDSMLEVFFGSDRTRLAGVWARDTLGLAAENYSQKVQTVKDLDIVWDAPAGLPPPVKITPPPMVVLMDNPKSLPTYNPTKPAPVTKTRIYTSTQLMPAPAQPNDPNEESQDRTTYWSVPDVRPGDPIPGLTGASSDIVAPTSSGLYSALNTLLLDDSPLKAHLQPYNNLTLPEYTAELRARDVRRRDTLEELMKPVTEGEAEKVEDENAEKSTAVPSKQQHFKSLRAAPFDKTLIAVIGVLSAVRHESSIVGWMRAGGMRPSVQEIARVAALVEEEQKGQEVEEEIEEGIGGEVVEDSGERLPSKRLSSPCPEDKQGSPKRPRRESRTMEVEGALLDAEAVTQEIQASSSAAPPAEDLPPLPTNQVQRSPIRAESPTIEPTPVPNPTSTPIPTAPPDNVPPVDPPNDTTPTPTSSLPAPAQDSSINKPTKRGRRRNRQKPSFPATHPLSAKDSYPFFTDGNPDEKLWFQDREIYTYWVRRGLLALKGCGIEPEAGVEGT